MARNARSIMIIHALVIVLILLAPTSSLTQAQEGGGEQEIPPQEGSVSISALLAPNATHQPIAMGPYAFVPGDPAYPPSFYHGRLINKNGMVSYYHAEVPFPNGVLAHSFGMAAIDNSLGEDLCATLYQYPFLSEGSIKLAEICTNSASPGLRGWGNTITGDPVIDLMNNYYEIVVVLPGNASSQLGLKGFLLTYDYPAAGYLPMVVK